MQTLKQIMAQHTVLDNIFYGLLFFVLIFYVVLFAVVSRDEIVTLEDVFVFMKLIVITLIGLMVVYMIVSFIIN